MLAISIVAPSGTAISTGAKTIEVRTWHPGQLPLLNLLIVENRRFLTATEPEDSEGFAVAIADVLEVHEWQKEEVVAACSKGWEPGYLAWSLSNVRALPGNQIVPARRKLYNLSLELTIEHGSSAA